MPTSHELPKLSGFVLWLMPCAKSDLAFRTEIARLSDRYDTVQFLPHLTLGRLSKDTSKEDILNLEKSLQNALLDDIYAEFDAIRCKDNPYQNLVASLNPTPALIHLQSEIESMIPGYIKKSEYHVSLMYGSVSCDNFQNRLKGLAVRLPQRVHFSKLSAVQLKGGPQTWQSVWTIGQ